MRGVQKALVFLCAGIENASPRPLATEALGSIWWPGRGNAQDERSGDLVARREVLKESLLGAS